MQLWSAEIVKKKKKHKIINEFYRSGFCVPTINVNDTEHGGDVLSDATHIIVCVEM